MAEDVELWGTFAVADHRRPQAFVADALLYDRLVIPVPRTGYRAAEWAGPWRADLLVPLLDTLGDLAVPMPWGSEDWQDGLRRHAQTRAVAEDMERLRAVDPDAPHFHVTRAVLADFANAEADSALFARLKALAKRPGSRVEAVTAYASAADLRAGTGLSAVAAASPAAAIRPAAVLNWTVHVPAGETDADLLRRAVTLAGRADFLEHRRAFNDHLRDLGGLADDAVRADLLKRLADHDRLMRRQGWHTAARVATQVLTIGSPLLALLDDVTGALAAVGLNAAVYTVTDRLALPGPDARTRVAAMAHDVQAAFGDRMRLGPG